MAAAIASRSRVFTKTLIIWWWLHFCHAPSTDHVPAGHSLINSQVSLSYYHDLWHVEASFRMSKTDLRARPLFARTQDAIEAHLTIVFTALAVAREAQNRTGLAIRILVRQLRTLRSATIAINGAVQTIPPAISPEQQSILDDLQQPRTHALGDR